MPKKISKEMAKNALRDVSPEQCFWVNNGPVVSNLEGLYGAINDMGKETFMHHINNEKNDFANWVRGVLGDGELADTISKTKRKKALSNAIKKRIAFLKKAAGA